MTIQTLVRTRTEYVRDRLISHHEYYAQFVTESTVAHVHAAFDVETLRAALAADPHLNSIPMPRWDALSFSELPGHRPASQGGGGPFRAVVPFDRYSALAAGETITRVTLVCITKCAARILVERATASGVAPAH